MSKGERIEKWFLEVSKFSSTHTRSTGERCMHGHIQRFRCRMPSNCKRKKFNTYDSVFSVRQLPPPKHHSFHRNHTIKNERWNSNSNSNTNRSALKYVCECDARTKTKTKNGCFLCIPMLRTPNSSIKSNSYNSST